MLIIELNEFCPKYLAEVAEILHLQEIKKFLKLKHTVTYTKDIKEFEGLDPWVQWVSIHNGIPMKSHGIKRLGVNSKKNNRQIWNTLAEQKNIKWIVTGAMNSKKGSKKGCISFTPDPWSFTEKAFPKDIENLLELPRYVAKNYLSLNFLKLIKKAIKTISFFFKIENLNLTRKFFIKLIQSLFAPGLNIHTLTTLFDYLLTLYFSREKNKKNAKLSIIFLNHIAHLQHNFWLRIPYIHPQMKHGMRICNEIIKILLETAHKDEQVLIINALKQKRTDKSGIQIYRQKDPYEVMKLLDIKNVKIEQNMTNDGILFFKTKSELSKAFEVLSNCKLSSGEDLFFVDKLSNLKLFLKLNINHYIEKDILIISGNKVFNFYNLFSNLNRTGSHIPEGDIYSKNIQLPKKLENHKIYNYIINAF